MGHRDPLVKLHPDDPVAIALEDLAAGTAVGAMTLVDPIPRGHKVALEAIPEGELVRRYGQIIGQARHPIAPGAHVHSDNLGMIPAGTQVEACSRYQPTAVLPEAQQATFQGIVRPDGRVATRNYLAVISTVNCSATVARYISDAFRAPDALGDFPNVDGVVAITHPTGCGMASDGEAIQLLRRTLAGYARHPNVAGVLFVGLGCETNQIRRLLQTQGLAEGELLQSLTMQGTGGTAATVREGVARLKAMLPAANAATRRPVPASHLTLGLQCGGSDGYSGISANPALGAAADLLIRHGGAAVLAETPEIYGAEHLLVERAKEPAVAAQLMDLIRWWQDYTARHGGEMDNNPSPGNKAGGLTTILEKSLGAVAKGGTTGLMEVIRYAEPVTGKGLIFMDSPGYDPVSVTGQVASGCNIVCFTTGRGSCFGCKPAPSLKLATNTPMYQRMVDDMDFNCGPVVDGEATVAEQGEQLFQLILATASGKATKSEALGYGDAEFTPWQLGAVM
ncbi:MAG: UxaA family hydrolase [Candidatus Competibacterales bacterium]